MLDFVIALLSSYFVEWVPNTTAAPGEWPWQGGAALMSGDKGLGVDPNG